MKHRTFLIIITLGFLTLMYSGCYKPFKLNGNNNVTSETRQMYSFNAVNHDADFNVFIEQDSIYQVIVQAESNLIPHIKTMVNGNTLVISTKENLHNNFPINIYVKTPTLNNVTLNGSGLVQTDTIVSNNFTVKLSGSGDMNGQVIAPVVSVVLSGSGSINYHVATENIASTLSGSGAINLSGTATNGNHIISGSGSLNSYNMLENYVQAKISGSGNMFVNVSNQLDVIISGSGSVYYVGNPQLNISISGSGSVIKQ